MYCSTFPSHFQDLVEPISPQAIHELSLAISQIVGLLGYRSLQKNLIWNDECCGGEKSRGRLERRETTDL
jgi:hypothetical protein